MSIPAFSLFSLSLSRRAESKKLISAVDKQSKRISSISTYASSYAERGCARLIPVDILLRSTTLLYSTLLCSLFLSLFASFVSVQEIPNPHCTYKEEKLGFLRQKPTSCGIGSSRLNRYVKMKEESE